MIGASKILTVSYGTFSCTLEGFDDSFGTMKAIAEYFRDLASDDRYFGAEPPTPDAEMLAKIAGREISRQVEAKIEDNGVTLRPIEQAAPAVAAVSTPVEQAPAAYVEPVVEEPIVEEPIVEEAAAPVVVPSFEYDDAQDEAQVEYVAPDASVEADTESVAAKLRRIRAVVAKNQTAGAAAPIFSEDQHAEGFEPQEEAPEKEVLESAVEVIEVPTEAPTEKATDEAEEEATSVEITEDAQDADISAMMGRISDEVADSVDAPQAEQQSTYEDEYEDDGADGNDAVTNILSQVAKEADSDDITEDDVDADAIIDGEGDVEDEVIAEDAPVVDTQDEVAVETTDEESPVVAADEAADDIIAEDAPQEPVKPVRPSRARIIKVKRADLQRNAIEDTAEDDTQIDVEETTQATDDIIADGTIEDEAPSENALDALGETSLSAEDEAELLADLADVEMEAPAEIDNGIDATMRIERNNRALHSEGGADDEASVSRLVDETNAKLDTDESSRRRSAISHLRAAVAATVADRKFNKTNEIKTPDEVDAYRTDLADVMRPQPVKAKGERNIERPAPLILVSEQRIDSEKDHEPSGSSPIRPRRILKTDVTLREVETGPSLGLADLSETGSDENADDTDANIFADSTSFADFAEKMGASELPDLLEAAAAYTAYVEGRPHFGRPQIMRQVAGFSGKDEFNREEGLRSFGQLLRQGKIIKVNRGKFEIAETTRFKPEARIAGE